MVRRSVIVATPRGTPLTLPFTAGTMLFFVTKTQSKIASQSGQIIFERGCFFSEREVKRDKNEYHGKTLLTQ